MAGLLDFVLPAIFSAGDSAKRQIKGLLGDPVGTVKQFVNNKNDQAAAHLADVNLSTQGRMAGLLGGQATPEQLAADQRVTQAMINAYNPAGMIVWHGSPHNFTKFDASKIGTGEGAQAYGHGLYLAESPGVAKSYADTLGFTGATDKGGNQYGKYELASFFENALKNKGIPDDAAKSQALLWADKFAKGEKISHSAAMDVIASKGLKPVDSGSLYKVDLPDEHIAKMLDWDKPLSQQQKQVASLIKKDRPHLFSAGEYPDTLTLGSDLAARGIKSGPQDVYGHNPATRYGVPAKHMTGQDYWHLFMRQTNNDAAAAANAMKALGFPGLRYLDGGSRAAGQGTANYVIFPGNEGLLTILERNGVPLR